MKKRILSLTVIVCILISCISFTAYADGLNLLNSITNGSIPTTSGKWFYNVDQNKTEILTDGMGGKAADDAYVRVTAPGTNTKRNGQLIMNKKANYYTKNYFVYTINVYGDSDISCSIKNGATTTYDITGLVANKWNNITFVYDKANSKFNIYINGVKTEKPVPENGKEGDLRICMDAAGTYYFDDIAIYDTDTAPVIAMPVANGGNNFSVSESEILYSEGATAADFITANPTAKVYTDSTLATEAEASALLAEGNTIAVSAPFNAAEENVSMYNYYTAAPAPITSGEVTDTIDWSYNTISKTLTFTGTGAMPDWSTGVNADNHIRYRPWIDYNAKMTKVVFGEGITSVGEYTFAQAKCLTDVEFSSTIEVIKSYSFFHTAITEIEFADGLKTIEAQAFAINNADVYKKLTKAVIPASVEFVHKAAFAKQTDITVYCYEESAAHKFAVNNGVEFFLYDADYAIVYDADTMTATIKNFNGEYEKATVIFSNTSTGVLNSVDFKEIDMPAIGEDATVSAETLTQNPGTATEIMLWDSMTSCKPLCSSVGKKFAQEVTPEEVTE